MESFTDITTHPTAKKQITVSTARGMIEAQTNRSFYDFAMECGYRIPDIYTRDILGRERTVSLSRVQGWIEEN